MKKIYTLLAFLFLLEPLNAQMTFTSSSQVISHLQGNWSWFRSCGGLAGICNYPSTVGYTRDLILMKINNVNDSMKYAMYQNSSLQHTQSVKISTVSNLFSGTWTLEDVLSAGSSSISLSLTLAKTDTIWLSEDCNDCFVHQYSRNKTVGLNEQNLSSRSSLFYPNPVTESIRLLLPHALLKEIQIFDLNGRILFREKNPSETLSLEQLPAGIYLFKWITQDNQEFFDKLVKVKN